MTESNYKCVYALLDPRKPGKYVYSDYTFKFEPFYIGKGAKSRPSQHTRIALKFLDKINFKNNKIRSIVNETGIHPIILVVQNDLSDEDAKILEGRLIKLIGSFLNNPSGPLTNVAKDSEHIPPGPKGDDHYTRKFPGLSKKIQDQAVAKHGYHFLSYTKEGVTRASLKVVDGTHRFLGSENPTKIRSINQDPSLVCGWLSPNATLKSKLGWFLRREIENLQMDNSKLGYKIFAKLTNKELKLLEIYGLELDENLPMKIAKYKKWTPEKETYWQEWKSSYSPIKICKK